MNVEICICVLKSAVVKIRLAHSKNENSHLCSRYLLIAGVFLLLKTSLVDMQNYLFSVTSFTLHERDMWSGQASVILSQNNSPQFTSLWNPHQCSSLASWLKKAYL